MEKKEQLYVLSFIFIIIIATTSFIALNNILLIKENKKNITSETSPQITTNAENFNLQFNGTRAFSYLKDQVAIGFRPPNSTGIVKTRALIVQQLLKFNWTVEFNNFTYKGIMSSNILAFPENSARTNITLFGAHYDTRWFADDPSSANTSAPVLGANDGASGVGVLMEFAQIFANRTDIALMFIDAEDQGDINGWIYCYGTYQFVDSGVLGKFFPNGKSDIKAFILLDMIGDWNLNLKKEFFSNQTINDQIWFAASILHYSTIFINESGYRIEDDHIPFRNIGVPAVDLIDFDYVDQYGNNLHHTTRDTLNYVSAMSLWIVGQTIEYWLRTSSQVF